jgi:hypothetical protein
MTRSAQTVHLSWIKISTISKWTETSFHLSLVTQEYHRVHPKQFSKPMVRLAQTVHLSWMKISTISERTETSFHLSLVTQEYHSVHPKQFLSLWYVWRKPCNYHSTKLTLSPKGPKGDSTWPTSPRSSIECVQNDLLGYDTFGVNYGSILRRD